MAGCTWHRRGYGSLTFFVDPSLVTNPGMPVWWPGFCGTIDIVLGGWLAIRLGGRRAETSERAQRVTTESERSVCKIAFPDWRNFSLVRDPTLHDAFKAADAIRPGVLRTAFMLRSLFPRRRSISSLRANTKP